MGGVAFSLAISSSALRWVERGSFTGVLDQPMSAALSGDFTVLSRASFIPSARRFARAMRFSQAPSLYFPAVTLPPAPLKWTWSVCGQDWLRMKRAMPGKSGVG